MLTRTSCVYFFSAVPIRNHSTIRAVSPSIVYLFLWFSCFTLITYCHRLMNDCKYNKFNIKMSKGDYKICVYKSCNSCSQESECTKCSDVFFVPFPNPLRENDKYKRWLQICKSKQRMLYISRYTSICSLHFVGGRGPTKEHPDPIAERHTKKEYNKKHKPTEVTKYVYVL